MANKPNKIVYGNQVLIDLTGDTVEPESLLKGITAHDKSGEIIEGTCEFDADTTDATASPSEILAGKTAYVVGAKVEGTMANRGGAELKISNVDDELSIQSGYHDGSGIAAIDDTEKEKIIAANIKSGVEILGVTGTFTGEGGQGQAKSATPYTDKAQTILPDEDYDFLTQVEVAQIKYVETPNEQGGITIEIGEKAPVTP